MLRQTKLPYHWITREYQEILSKIEHPKIPEFLYDVYATPQELLNEFCCDKFDLHIAKLGTQLARKLYGAQEGYFTGRDKLLVFVENREEDCFSYFQALDGFEQCLSNLWIFFECLRKSPPEKNGHKFNYFNEEQGELFQTLHRIYTYEIKHVTGDSSFFNEEQEALLPITLDDIGIQTISGEKLTYFDLHDLLKTAEGIMRALTLKNWMYEGFEVA